MAWMGSGFDSPWVHQSFSRSSVINTTMKIKKVRREAFWLGAGLLIGLVFGIILGARFLLPTPVVAPLISKGASVMFDYGNGNIVSYDLAPAAGENLFQATKDLAAKNNLQFDYKDYKGLGVLVTQIGNDKNGAGGRYWQYWVNDKLAPVGASDYVIRSGDVIEWKFTLPKE